MVAGRKGGAKGGAMAARTVVFDAYGTLFDVSAAARAAAATPAGAALSALWPQIAEDWRRKQLEYTWLRAIMHDHADFAQVTADALDWTLAAHGLGGALRPMLLSLYDRLEAYPEVPGALDALARHGCRLAILSNGTPGMLAAATAAAGIADRFAAVISVEEAGVYKPDAAVYRLVTGRFGLRPDEVVFVSSNGWDIAGAARFGFATVWVNRAGLPVDRLPDGPRHIIPDLAALAGILEAA